jgi:hypothetical protein
LADWATIKKAYIDAVKAWSDSGEELAADQIRLLNLALSQAKKLRGGAMDSALLTAALNSPELFTSVIEHFPSDLIEAELALLSQSQ